MKVVVIGGTVPIGSKTIAMKLSSTLKRGLGTNHYEYVFP